MMNSPMKDEDVERIVFEVGFEQILVDAELTVEQVAMILDGLGYIELEMYLDED
jgi:hypothetical protein